MSSNTEIRNAPKPVDGVGVVITINDFATGKDYAANWRITEKALENPHGLTRERLIANLMIKLLQSEPAIHLLQDPD